MHSISKSTTLELFDDNEFIIKVITIKCTANTHNVLLIVSTIIGLLSAGAQF